ncbi:MAG: choice-of-anchor D domain-containing protein [Planctomycetes bacterium]|nr:choice-of-anchor D domain-containing protein [Planctomycetota bacterium]
MCKQWKKLCAITCVLLFGATSLSAQITSEVLTGAAESAGTGSGYPINTFWHDLRSESIYLASDLTGAGLTGGSMITAIGFKCAQLPGRAITNVRIRVQQTTATTVTGTFVASGYTDVYGPTTIPISSFTVGNWFTFTFTTPIAWNGTSNLLIDYSCDDTGYTSGGGCYMRSVAGTRTTYGYDDSGYTYPFAGMEDGTRTLVPSMRITYTGGSLTIISSPSMPTGAEGVFYTQTLQAVAGTTPYTWALIGGALPSGVTLSTGGVISGTPAVSTGGQQYNFTVRVTDNVAATDTENFTLYIQGPPAALPFLDDFSVDKGWTLGSGSGLTWQRGPCGAPYTPPYGGPEPTTDHSPGTDNYILGDNIGAVYPNSMGSTIWATSPPINCSSTSDVELSYWRWLNVEDSSYDHAYIAVSNNGTAWTQVYTNVGAVGDTGWTQHKLNISAVAGNQGSVRVRFGIGTTDSSWQFAGWCIDDVELRELPSTTKLVCTDFTIVSPYTVGSQNDPKVYTGTQANFSVTVNNTTANNITVNSFTVAVTNYTTGNAENVGTFTLTPTIPFVVNANTTAQVIQGVFNCTALAAAGANTTLQARARLQGTEASTNKPVETERDEILYVDQGPPPPPPEMNVHETNFQGALVGHNQAAAGTLRDFQSRDINAGPGSWLNIVIINNTTSSINIGTPTLGGTDAAHFRLDTAQWTSSTMTITTSGSTSQIYFSVRFDPHALGQLDAYVEFTHNATAPTTTPYRVLFTGTGTGTAPELEVHEIDYTGPKVTLGQAAAGTNRDFGTVATGGSSGWVNIVIWNRFATDTTINPLPTLSAGNTADFVIDTSAMSNPHVIPGTTAFTGTTYFSIRFAPQSAGSKAATVSFGHNASNPATTPFTFEVVGSGIASGSPAIFVQEATAPASQAGTTTFTVTNGQAAANGRDFGDQVITAGPTGYLTIRITNTGSQALVIGNPTLGGTAPGHFQLSTVAPWAFVTSINAGATSEFGIRFDPTSAGVKNATVSFTHNATAQTTTPFTFGITGNGLLNAPIIEVRETDALGAVIGYNDPAAGTLRAFGGRDVNAGASAALTIYIENIGSAPMTLGTPVVTGTQANQFVVNSTGMLTTLAVGVSTTFSVAFDPSSYGAKIANVTFAHDDPLVTNPFSFEVSGFGDAPSIEVREGSAGGPILVHNSAPAGGRDFGTVLLASMPTAPVTIVIVNAGNANLTVQAPTITGPNASSFSLTAVGFPATVAPSSLVSFTVTFNASQVGLKEATINFAHNDSGNASPFQLPIQGVAADPAGVQIDTNTTLSQGQVGQVYGPVDLRASGGTAPYTWSQRNGTTLPVGLSMTTAGVISGTPAGPAGIFQFDLRVTDAAGGTADRTFSLTVQPAPGSGFSGGGGGGGGGGCETGHGTPWLLMALAALGTLVLGLRRRSHRA